MTVRYSVSPSGATSVNWGVTARGAESFDTFRRSHVLYETPSLLGFTLQAAVANDNFWDIALRYAGEFHGVRLAAALQVRVVRHGRAKPNSH